MMYTATMSAAQSSLGEIRSLTDIIAAVRGKLPGEVAGVEIERKDGRWQYEFRVVDSQGRLFDALYQCPQRRDRAY